jgi:hypothetical protein
VSHEAAAPAGGAEGDAIALEQDDLPARVILPGEQGGPEAGESAADDDEIGLAIPLERIAGVGRAGLGQPEGAWLRIGVGASDCSGVHGHAA